jgi:hypothetical protein
MNATLAFAIYWFCGLIIFGWITDRRDSSGDRWE